MSEQEPHQPVRGDSERNARVSNRRRSNRDRGRNRDQNPPQRHENSFNMDELRALVALITDNGLTEFEFENAAIRVRLCRNQSGGSSAQSSTGSDSLHYEARKATGGGHKSVEGGPSSYAEPTRDPSPEPPVKEDLHTIPSPIVGTFYRSPSPTGEPFVRIGSHINTDTVVCIIEAMKLMNEIQAEVSGEIVKIYVENGQPVEYGQPLFGVKR